MKLISLVPAAALALPGLADEVYDYVIVGGGTCGLVLANRLSSDPNVTVAVIDPGQDVRGNANVTNPAVWTNNIGSAIDWQYESVPQPEAGNRSLIYNAGKAIGGTSTINGMTYIRANRPEVDAWEALGNKGWTWDSLYPYYKRMEHFLPPTPAQAAAGASYLPLYHGEDGPIKVSFIPELEEGPFAGIAAKTWNAVGYPTNPDVNSGSMQGFDVWPMTVDGEVNLRQDAATVFYWPVAERSNLHLLNGTARRVLWRDEVERADAPGGAVATGLEYISPDSLLNSVSARKEVILSAGALRTPPILELSGVGNSRVLKILGIEQKINLPGVGENLQDQPNINLAYQGTINLTGYAPYATYASAQDLFGEDTSSLASAVKANLSSWAQGVSERSGIPAHAIEKVFEVQHGIVFNNNTTIAEILTTGLSSTYLSVFWGLLPFARGSVHLQSASAEFTNQPLIDPAIFRNEFDLFTQITIGKLAQKYWLTDPAKGSVADNSPSGPANDAEWLEYIRDNFAPNHHPIGTAAMMRRELGGVVSDELKVYGTSNLRVVDASILPLQVSGHLTSTLYAVAERAAEMIQAARGV